MTKRKEHPEKTGRKTDYDPKYDRMANGFALLGLTDKRMAELFNITEKTLNNWKKHHPSFLQSIKSGKEPADVEITHSLFDRAKGFEWDEQVPTKVKEVKYENGKRVSEIEHVVVTTVHRVVPPDSRAIQYWLNNRRRRKSDDPEEQKATVGVWADRHEVDHTTGGDKLPAPQVYLPTDLPDPVLEETTGVDPLTNS